MTIYDLYRTLLENMGHQGNWPAESPEELIAGAILVQNTRWENAQISLARISERLNGNFQQLHSLPLEDLQELIQASGFYKNKSRALHELFSWLASHKFNYSQMDQNFGTDLRKALLDQFGMGQETADVLQLYIFNRPVFVADKYAQRLFSYLTGSVFSDYTSLSKTITLTGFTIEDAKQFHILIDEFGKRYCKPGTDIKDSFLSSATLKKS